MLAWDDDSCLGAPEFQIIHGLGSGLPASLGGSYAIQPASPTQCNIATSPENWFGVPDPSSDSSRFLWFLVLANDNVSTEGSWGTDGTGVLGYVPFYQQGFPACADDGGYDFFCRFRA